MFPPKPKDKPIIDWAVTAIAEIRRLERELKDRDDRITAFKKQYHDSEERFSVEHARLRNELIDRDKTIAELQRQIDKQESRIGQLVTQVESLKCGRVL